MRGRITELIGWTSAPALRLVGANHEALSRNSYDFINLCIGRLLLLIQKLTVPRNKEQKLCKLIKKI